MAVQELLVRLGLDSSSFSKKLQAVNKEIKILDTTFSGISKEVNNFENTQQGLAQKTDYLKEKISLLEGITEEAKTTMKNLGTEVETIKGRMEDFQSKIDLVNKEIQKNEEALSLAKQQYEQVSSSVSKLQGIEKTFEEANASITKHNEIISNSEKAYAGLDTSITKNNSQIEKLKLENTQLDTKISEVCKSLNLNEKELLNLSNQYAKTNEKVTKLTTQYEKVSQKYGENSEQARKLKAEIDKYNTTAERQRTLLEAIPSDVQKLSQAYTENLTKIEKLELANKNMAQTQTQLKAKIQESRVEIQKQEQAYQQAQQQLNSYGTKTKTLEEGIKQVKLLLAQENSALKETSSNVKTHEDRIKSLVAEQKSLQQQLDKTKKNFTNKSKEMQDTELKMQQLIASTKELNRQLAETQIDRMFVGLTDSANRLESMGNSLTAIGGHIQSVGTALTMGLSVPLAGLGKKVVSTFTSFEERIRKVNAVFGGSAENMNAQFNKISESARKFGRETEWTAEQVGEAFEYMATAGWSVEKSMDSMGALLKLATIDMLDLGTASDIVTDTMTPFQKNLNAVGEEIRATGKEFNEADYMVDIFAQTANKTNTNVTLMGESMKYAGAISAEAGADFRDVAIATGLMANAGVKGSMAGTSLAQGITRLLAPTDKGAIEMKKFGIEVAKNADGGMDLKATIENLRKAFSGMDEQTTIATAKVIFGQTALKGWLPLISASADEFNDLTDAIYNSAGASDLFMEEISQSGAYQFKIMTSAIQDLLIVIGDALAPALKDVAGQIAEFSTKFSNWVSRMKETNPELITMIGKLSLLAIVVPPVITAFGLLTGGIGKMMVSSANATKGFVNMSSNAIKLAQGITVTDSEIGLFTKGLASLIGKFGGLAVGFGAGIVALGGLATAIGTSETSISFLIDKLGVLGTAVSGTCEFIAGIVQVTIGNIIQLLKGLGRSIKALFTGKFFQIDDIWEETWSSMKETTKQGISNLNMESTRAISDLKNVTSDGAKTIVETFKATMQGLKGVTMDNVGDVASTFAEQFQGLNSQTLNILRGTSDQMTSIFYGIREGMSIEESTKRFQQNLSSMVSSGKLDLNKLAKEFDNAQEMISTHMATGTNNIKKEALSMLDEFGKISSKGMDSVLKNNAQILKSMDEDTFKTLKSIGGSWGKLFEDINDIGSLSVEQLMEIMKSKVADLKFDTPEGIKQLEKELTDGFTGAYATIDEATGEMVQNTSSQFQTLVDTIKNGSESGLDEVANVFAEGLKTLDAETVTSLMNTSDQWYSILNGTVDESGNLIENLSTQILWNLGWVSEQSPEKLEGFKDGLLNALTEANLITSDEMKAIVETIDAKTEEMAEASEGAGEETAENLTPTGTADSVREELEAVTQAYQEKTQGIVQASSQAGEQAQQKFDEKVSEIGKDVQVDSNILNVEELNTNFQNAGVLAVQSFVTGWSNNNELITEAINLALTSITTDLSAQFEAVNVNIDGVVQKCVILNDNITLLNTNMANLQGISFEGLFNGLSQCDTNAKAFKDSVMSARTQLILFTQTSTEKLMNSLSIIRDKFREIRVKIIEVTGELVAMSGKDFNPINSQMEKFKSSTDKAKKSLDDLISSIDKVISKSLSKLHGQIDTTTNKLNTAKYSSDALKDKLYELNYVSFDSLISKLSNLESWLSSVKSTAKNTSYAIQQVKKPSLFSLDGAEAEGNSFFDFTPPTSNLDMAKYKTKGGFYSPQSMVGKTSQSLNKQSQDEQLKVMQEQNELLKQLLLATMNNSGGDVNLSVNLDGKQIAKSSAKYMEKEITTLNKRKARLGY